MKNSMNNGAANNNSNNAGGRIMMASGTIQTMEVFADTVKSVMEAIYDDGYRISVEPVTKNNGTHFTRIAFHKKGTNISPAVYLDELFEAYQNGMTMEEVCRNVRNTYERCKPKQDFDDTRLTDFNQVKDLICFKLVNAEKNREMLADTPYIPYNDLVIIFYVVMAKSEGGVASILIKDSHMKMWGTDAQTMYSLAMKNTQRIFRGSIQPMGSVVAEIMERELDAEDSNEFYDMAVDTENMMSMYVASNYERLNGASVLLYPNLLRDFAERIGADFYILPSSIHELIFLSESAGIGSESLKMLVQEVNATEVEDDEILSDNIYFYSRAYDRVEMM